MDQWVELDAPGLDALGFEALQGEAVGAAAVEQLVGGGPAPDLPNEIGGVVLAEIFLEGLLVWPLAVVELVIVQM